MISLPFAEFLFFLSKNLSSRAKSAKLLKEMKQVVMSSSFVPLSKLQIAFAYFFLSFSMSGNFSWSWMFSWNWWPCKSWHKRQRSIGGHQFEGHWRRWRDAITSKLCEWHQLRRPVLQINQINWAQFRSTAYKF